MHNKETVTVELMTTSSSSSSAIVLTASMTLTRHSLWSSSATTMSSPSRRFSEEGSSRGLGRRSTRGRCNVYVVIGRDGTAAVSRNSHLEVRIAAHSHNHFLPSLRSDSEQVILADDRRSEICKRLSVDLQLTLRRRTCIRSKQVGEQTL